MAHPRAFPITAAVLTAGAVTYVSPAVDNQNHYLLHAAATTNSQLASDWTATAQDPAPIFTALITPVYTAVGPVGIQMLTALTVLAALTGVYVLARTLSNSRGIATIAMVASGLTLSVPHVRGAVFGSETVTAFQGFAAQYLLTIPVYLQPSAAGTLVLVAFAFWYAAMRGGARRARIRYFAGLVCAVVGVLIHTWLAVAVAMAVGAAMLADLVTRSRPSRQRLLAYGSSITAAGLAFLAGNPTVVSLGAGQQDNLVSRFAFERLPHHTLMENWSAPTTVRLIALIVAACLVLWFWRPRDRWLAVWLGVLLLGGLVAANVVSATMSAQLALLFPWRVSTLLVPVAFTVVIVAVARYASRWRFPHWRSLMVGGLVVLAMLGLAQTATSASPSDTDPATLAVRAANPQGTGLIPLKEQFVRFGAEVPVYVDWKTTPFTGADMSEWYARYDRVAQFEEDPSTFCTAEWAGEISWILLRGPRPDVPCLTDWTASISDRYTVLERPSAG